MSDLDRLKGICSLKGGIIIDNTGTGLKNLSQLADLKHVSGGLDIGRSDINDFSGLSSLVTIGESLRLYENDFLTKIDFFDDLEKAGQLEIFTLDFLTQVDFPKLKTVLRSIDFTQNTELLEIRGLDKIEEIQDVNFEDNDKIPKNQFGKA